MISAELLREVIAIAVKAGEAILEIYNSDDPGITFKADRSPLTLADRASHEVIVNGLQAVSKYPLLSEEGSTIPYEVRKNWETFWLIDPLDGTKEFIKKNGEFTVNIALIQVGVPVMGVVYCPVQKKLYYGSSGVGSLMMEHIGTESINAVNDRIKKAKKLPLPSERKIFTVVASRSHVNRETEQYLKKLSERYGELQIVSKGSSLKLCLVAEGAADLYPRLGPTMEWDTAAADAVVRYAGGTVLRYDSNTPLIYNKPELLNPFFVVFAGFLYK